MRPALLACLCLMTAAACGGNFSNDDLEFVNALPRREDLAAKLPEGADKRQGGHLTTRVDGLQANLGEVSSLATDTYATGTQFNRSVDALLSLLENFRNAAPTTRDTDRRVWGPFPDKDHPGFELRFVMERQEERFDYRLEFRRRGEDEAAWWAFLTGFFQADAGIRKGTGELALDVKLAAEKGFSTGDLAELDRMDIHYQTKTPPTWVELLFTARDGGAQASYTYRETASGLGEMKFRVPDADLVPGNRLELLSLTTRWLPDGRGVGVLEVLDGDIKGARYTECWDTQVRVRFLSRNWDFLNPYEGERAACPDTSELDE